MEQLSAGINDTIQRNQLRLEEILSSNVDNAIVYGLKGLVSEMNALEAEQRFSCVQCNKEFRRSTNGPKACSFHRGEFFNKGYQCCGTSASPCEFRSHREKHHCDYPYETFFEYSRAILNYVDTVDQWSSIEDTNLETDAIQKASAGILLRWKSRGTLLDKLIILIHIGTISFRDPYFFDALSTKELQSITAALSLTGNTLIYRTSSSDSEYAMAEWILSTSGNIIGIRLTAKAATSVSPCIRACHFDISTRSLTGAVIPISEGGFHTYKPSSPYVLPPMVRFGPELSDEPVRAVRTDFKSRTSSNFPVVLKCSSDPPLTANTQSASSEVDSFDCMVSVFNNQPNGSPNTITIASGSAFYRLVGNEEYLQASSYKIKPQLPVSIKPRQSYCFKLSISVSRSPEDIALGVHWWNRAFIARERPIRIKIKFEGTEGEECLLVMEYVYKPFKLPKKSDEDFGLFFFDNPITATRAHIAVQKITDDNSFIKFDNRKISERTLTKLVYRALKTGVTEVDLGIGGEKYDREWKWVVYALIDLSCGRVYAFKVILQEGKKRDKKRFGCMGYVLCPEYGRVIDDPHTIQYATEKAKLPKLEPYSSQSFVIDAAADDYVPEIKSSAISTAAASVHLAIPEEVNIRLNSIDDNLSRIATALELMVDGFKMFTSAQERK